MKSEGVIQGTPNNVTVGLKYSIVRSMFRRPRKHETSTYTPASGAPEQHGDQGQRVASLLLGKFRETAELNNSNITGGDIIMSANAESRARWKRRGVTTLLIPPLALIPMCPDRGFWRPLWLCGDAEERNLACRHAESLPLVSK